jgi:hypothetical protein
MGLDPARNSELLTLRSEQKTINLFLPSSREGIVQILVEGQTIRHDQYGVGIVTESNNDRTTIDFDDHGLKKFVTSIWSAELIGEPPAERPTKRRGRRKTAKKA